MEKIILKKSKEYPIKAGHPWIFSNAIENGDSFRKNSDSSPKGSSPFIVEVYSIHDEFLGLGIYNELTSIRIRMLTNSSKANIDVKFFIDRFRKINERKLKMIPKNTTGYRISNGDADYLPGLILDKYDDAIVFQIHTKGMENLRKFILEAIENVFDPKIILERSDISSRKMEGLNDLPVTIHKGEINAPVKFEENGFTFFADILHGQKTGFFLDQRDARAKTETLSLNKKVLNLFSYTCGFGVYALRGGAKSIENIDSSQSALELGEENFKLNFDNYKNVEFIKADVLDYVNDCISENKKYDLIICDPPGFAKSKFDVDNAVKAYTELNKRCMSLLNAKGIILSSSCSGMIKVDEFKNILKYAAGLANKDLQIISYITQPYDHTEKISFPEGQYLKTFILECL
jgi:23S rRNA (cytosine1962-C5)-methyltransferase